MSKIDKTDVENIKLLIKEAKLSKLSLVKIKKGNLMKGSTLRRRPDISKIKIMGHKNKMNLIVDKDKLNKKLQVNKKIKIKI